MRPRRARPAGGMWVRWPGYVRPSASQLWAPCPSSSRSTGCRGTAAATGSVTLGSCRWVVGPAWVPPTQDCRTWGGEGKERTGNIKSGINNEWQFVCNRTAAGLLVNMNYFLPVLVVVVAVLPSFVILFSPLSAFLYFCVSGRRRLVWIYSVSSVCAKEYNYYTVV